MKKKSKIFILLLIIVILLLLGYILYIKGFIRFPMLEKTINKEDKTNNDIVITENIDITNESVIALYNEAHNKFIVGIDQFVYNNKKLTLDDMDTNYKMGLAANYFYDKLVPNYQDYSKTVYEDEVKSAYERIFGQGTYKRVDKFNLGCGDYVFDSSTNSYKNTTDACGGAYTFLLGEKMIKATKTDNILTITSAVVFYDGDTNTLYKDYNKTNKIRNMEILGNFNEELEDYVYNNFENLDQYNYKYQLDKDGFYYYIGVEKVEEEK